MRKITLNIIAGVLLVLCGILEGFDTVLEEFAGVEFKGHYSIIVIALVHFIYAATDIVDGVATMKEQSEDKQVGNQD